MPKHASTDPTERMGVYTRLEDVPLEHRLDQYIDVYSGLDTWQDYIDSRPAAFDSTHYQNTLSKAGDSWKAHMERQGRHHALARPVDVEAWLQSIADTRTHGTVYSEYWIRVEEFYTWLQFHTDHPHLYHPPLMAVVDGGLAGQLWRLKFCRKKTESVEQECDQ